MVAWEGPLVAPRLGAQTWRTRAPSAGELWSEEKREVPAGPWRPATGLDSTDHQGPGPWLPPGPHCSPSPCLGGTFVSPLMRPMAESSPPPACTQPALLACSLPPSLGDCAYLSLNPAQCLELRPLSQRGLSLHGGQITQELQGLTGFGLSSEQWVLGPQVQRHNIILERLVGRGGLHRACGWKGWQGQYRRCNQSLSQSQSPSGGYLRAGWVLVAERNLTMNEFEG